MKKILISSFDMEVGGVERSLISMLSNFDYKNNKVDLMLYSHTGDFMKLLPSHANLLSESKLYKTFRMSIAQILRCGEFPLGLARLLAKYKAGLNKFGENGLRQMQYMWKYSLPFLPSLPQKYDVAISYLWPHYFVSDKVTAKTKVAWIHTDYSSVDTDIELDLEMWNKFDHIVAVSEECKKSFISKYRKLASKVMVIENLNSPEFIRKMADEKVDSAMFNDHRFKLITVARLSHAKGIDNAVKALKILKTRGYHDIAWYVVGYGGDEDLIRGLIDKNGLADSFILLGKKSNPYPYVKKSDLYVQPSRYEGKAVTVTEAQILGRPVLITNYPTAGSQVKDMIDGWITPLSVKGIADGIEMLYRDEKLRLKLADNCCHTDHCNSGELEKLYRLLN